jgi:hypothetical protein
VSLYFSHWSLRYAPALASARITQRPLLFIGYNTARRFPIAQRALKMSCLLLFFFSFSRRKRKRQDSNRLPIFRKLFLSWIIQPIVFFLNALFYHILVRYSFGFKMVNNYDEYSPFSISFIISEISLSE